MPSVYHTAVVKGYYYFILTLEVKKLKCKFSTSLYDCDVQMNTVNTLIDLKIESLDLKNKHKHFATVIF